MLPAIGEYIIYENGTKSMKNEGVSLMKMCTESGDLDIFEIQKLTEIIQYKWDRYGLKYYSIGFAFHIYYVIM